jgi:N,N-dimethylformamidase
MFTDYIPFFVAPTDTTPAADLAVWLSEYSYMAYSNVSLVVTARDNYPGHNFNEDDAKFYAANKEYATGGVYNKHVDGLYFTYGSRLRPDLHMKPGGLVYNFVQDTHITAFLEHEGIPYDIITDELVQKEGVELLERYRVVMSGTHPEYVTQDHFDAVREYLGRGGRFVYTGANGWFWSVSTPPSRPGAMESRNFANWAERFLRDGSRGGAIIETGRSTASLFGVEMSGMVFNGSGHYRKTADAADPRAAFLFEGVEGETFGDYGVDRVRGGAAGFEIDRANFRNGTPRHALVVARSEGLSAPIEDVKLLEMPLGISYHPDQTEPWAEANLVFFETSGGGAVLSTGSIAWVSSTLENDFDNDVARITRNALRRFLDPEPFPPVPASSADDVNRAPRDPEYGGR